MTRPVTLYAWVGEDELGSGEVGLKRLLQAGRLEPLCLTEDQRDPLAFLTREDVVAALQAQVDHFRKPMSLMRYEVAEEILHLEPKKAS